MEMDNYNTEPNAGTVEPQIDQPLESPQIETTTECAQAEAPDPLHDKSVRKKLRKLYNSACLTLLFQLLISTAISGVISFIYSFVLTVATLVQNPSIPMEELIEHVTDASLNPLLLIITTTVSYLIANVLSYFIGNAMTNKHRKVKLFGKIQMKPLDCVLSVFAIIGIQMISALIQSLIMSLTGLSGVDETTASILSFSDNIFQNIVLVLYTVIIAAITEELICRGVIIKAFGAKSATFALFASALVFGIMHGNFNQMFNGFLLGLVIGYAALKSRSIILPIILHMCANGHAMILAVFEYAFGEQILIPELIYMCVMAVAGIVAIVLLLVRNGMPKNEADGYPVVYTVDGIEKLENQKGLAWGTLFKSVSFWIFTAIYTIIALISVTALAV